MLCSKKYSEKTISSMKFQTCEGVTQFFNLLGTIQGKMILLSSIKFFPFFKKKKRIDLFRKSSYREREGDLTCWFSLSSLSSQPWVRPEPGASSGSATLVGTQTQGPPSTVFPDREFYKELNWKWYTGTWASDCMGCQQCRWPLFLLCHNTGPSGSISSGI